MFINETSPTSEERDKEREESRGSRKVKLQLDNKTNDTRERKLNVKQGKMEEVSNSKERKYEEEV